MALKVIYKRWRRSNPRQLQQQRFEHEQTAMSLGKDLPLQSEKALVCLKCNAFAANGRAQSTPATFIRFTRWKLPICFGILTRWAKHSCILCYCQIEWRWRVLRLQSQICRRWYYLLTTVPDAFFAKTICFHVPAWLLFYSSTEHFFIFNQKQFFIIVKFIYLTFFHRSQL